MTPRWIMCGIEYAWLRGVAPHDQCMVAGWWRSVAYARMPHWLVRLPGQGTSAHMLYWTWSWRHATPAAGGSSAAACQVEHVSIVAGMPVAPSSRTLGTPWSRSIPLNDGGAVSYPPLKLVGFTLALPTRRHPGSLAGLQQPDWKYFQPRLHQPGQRTRTMCKQKRLAFCGCSYQYNHTQDRYEKYYEDLQSGQVHPPERLYTQETREAERMPNDGVWHAETVEPLPACEYASDPPTLLPASCVWPLPQSLSTGSGSRVSQTGVLVLPVFATGVGSRAFLYVAVFDATGDGDSARFSLPYQSGCRHRYRLQCLSRPNQYPGRLQRQSVLVLQCHMEQTNTR